MMGACDRNRTMKRHQFKLEEERLTILMIIEAQIAVFKELVNGTTSISREEFADLLCSIMPASYKDRIM